MKGRLYANWLVIITLFLFFSSMVIFVISIKDTIGIKKCAYGDDLGDNCVCSNDGKKVCDINQVSDPQTDSWTTENLSYSFDYLNRIDVNNPSVESVKFVDISHIDTNLKITIELRSMCNEDNTVAPQIGFYKLEEDKLILSIVSNLSNETFNLPCISENIFLINGFNTIVDENFVIQFQDEYESVYLANNCVYEEYLRNNGDVYNSKDGELLCQCKDGKNSCEAE